MTFADILSGIGFVAGAMLVGWGYTFTQRGMSVGRDIERADRGSRWWMRKAVVARHWPLIALISVYALAFGLIAAQFP